MKIITLQIKFSESDYRKLKNLKEEAFILGECKTWQDYILKLAGVGK